MRDLTCEIDRTLAFKQPFKDSDWEFDSGDIFFVTFLYALEFTVYRVRRGFVEVDQRQLE